MLTLTKALKFTMLCAMVIGVSACKVVKLDENNKPIIPMSAAEASKIKNMEPDVIAQKLWPQVTAQYQDAESIDRLDFSVDTSTFVKVDGTVTDFQPSALGNKMTVSSGDYVIPLQLGPVVRGNTIRDALDFISFDQFKNQVQYARLSKELSKQALSHIDAPDESWVSSKIDLIAAITLKNGQIVSAVPLKMARR
ncbi:MULTISPECIES: DUF2291 family protein [Marinomonas]|jgi:predicted lipoprotein|uniref:DUF2291 family protein n=2 Tax=Marinomonas TaxID=28253 RepID=A0ABX7IM97_9GAMM|nr:MULTISPECIES: DUF2291 family protein [Marinomonas]PYF84131.1 putative lipoprotein [Marinomonas alcarazii]QRV23458.1 DUF2291 family protein [Marinomonas foliarum]